MTSYLSDFPISSPIYWVGLKLPVKSDNKCDNIFVSYWQLLSSMFHFNKRFELILFVCPEIRLRFCSLLLCGFTKHIISNRSEIDSWSVLSRNNLLWINSTNRRMLIFTNANEAKCTLIWISLLNVWRFITKRCILTIKYIHKMTNDCVYFQGFVQEHMVGYNIESKSVNLSCVLNLSFWCAQLGHLGTVHWPVHT